MLDLNSKGFCIFGLPDSGKSTLTNHILNAYGKGAFVYDTLAEYDTEPYDSYIPEDRNNPAELEQITRNILASHRYSLFVIDEANRFCPSKPAPLPQAIADLNDWRAHYDLGVGFIARRPVQLNQDLTELAHYLFIFQLDGRNDVRYLNDLKDGLGDAVTQLKPYHYIVYYKGHDFELYSPVSKTFATNKKLKA